LVIALITTVAILALLVALVRHALLLGRTARRMQDEVAPIAGEIAADVERASETASTLRAPSFRSS